MRSNFTTEFDFSKEEYLLLIEWFLLSEERKSYYREKLEKWGVSSSLKKELLQEVAPIIEVIHEHGQELEQNAETWTKYLYESLEELHQEHETLGERFAESVQKSKNEAGVPNAGSVGEALEELYPKMEDLAEHYPEKLLKIVLRKSLVNQQHTAPGAEGQDLSEKQE